MKRIFACVLAIVMLLTLCACDSKSKGEPSTVQPVDMDIEVLRGEWRDGSLTFANGEKISLPCTIDEISKASGFRVADTDGLAKTLKPDEEKNFFLVGDQTQIRLTVRNKTEEPLVAEKATVISYSFTNSFEGNQKVKFASSLTMNVTREDVEDSLGLPDGAKSEDTMYRYKGRDDKKRQIELRVNFNSNDMVNSVAFYVGTI